MRYVAVSLLFATAAFAQKAVTVDQLPAAMTRFDGGADRASLPCSVEPIQPSLNFGLRFQTGYVFRTSLDAYQNGKHSWYIVFEVTPPRGDRPVYFLDSIDIPPGSTPGMLADASGTFLLGEGHYEVKWTLLDDLGRVCRAQWSLDARLAGNEKTAKVLMAPGTVGDFSWHPAAVTAPPPAGSSARHITVLMNAALPVRRQFTPAVSQWGTLVSILESLVELMPGVSVRLVVFNQDQQREIFRQEGFTTSQMSQVSHAVDGMEQWKVDSHVLMNPSGGWNLLGELENKEIHAAAPADTVVFLGLADTSREKMPPGMPERGAGPAFLYLQCLPGMQLPANIVMNSKGPPRGLAQSARTGTATCLPGAMSRPDAIDQTVHRLKGKTIVVSCPAQLAKAVETIQR